MSNRWITFSLCAASALSFTLTTQAQMKTAREFEAERDAKPAYRIVLENGRFRIVKPQKPQNAANATKAELVGSEWEMVAPVYAGLQVAPSLKFQDERIGASVGCNSIGAAFQLNGQTLTLSQGFSTRMACEEPIMRAETAYISSLEGAHKIALSPDKTRLTMTRGAQKLTFRRVNQNLGNWRSEGTKILNVEPTLGPMMDGDATPKYLQLEDLSQGTSWGKFTHAKIEGFRFEQANQYQLIVEVERNARNGEKRLVLKQILSQKFLGKWVPKPNEAVWEVAPTRVDCELGPEKCLQVRVMGGEPFEGQWRALSQEIKDFSFQDGFKFRLAVRTLGSANAPRYELIRLIERMPVTQ